MNQAKGWNASNRVVDDTRKQINSIPMTLSLTVLVVRYAFIHNKVAGKEYDDECGKLV